MAKLITSDLTNLSSESSAATSINTNFNSVEVAVEKTLSRDGTTPNQMEADFDMNLHDVLNVDTLYVNNIVTSGSGGTTVTVVAEITLESINALRNFNTAGLITSSTVFLKSYLVGLRKGGGYFQLDLSDTTSLDDGGTIIVDVLNRRWKRLDLGLVDVFMFGAIGDAANPVDDFPAVQRALDYATLSGTTGKGMEIFVPPGRYMLSQSLLIPNATVFRGAGRQVTTFRSLSGFISAQLISDKGNAGKIFIQDMRIETLGVGASITAVVRLGYGATPFGQAGLSNLYIAGHAGVIGLDHKSNVASFTEIEVSYYLAGGVGNNIDYNEGASTTVTLYDNCFSLGAVQYGFKLNGSANLKGIEIEAPASGCIPIYANRETHISGITVSQSNGAATTLDCLIEVDVASTSFFTTPPHHFNGSGMGTLTHVIKDNRVTMPDYWGDVVGSQKRPGLIADNVHIGYGLYIKDHKRQSFKLHIIRPVALNQHKISSHSDPLYASSHADRITGATVVLTDTPTAADASTAFAAGAKISSANTNNVFLNTAASQTIDAFACTAIVSNNTTTTVLTVNTGSILININGVERDYPVFGFYIAGTTTRYNLTTMPVGSVIEVTVEGFFR